MEARLLKWLDAHDITQAEIGRVIGVEDSGMSRKLRGHRSIRLSEARQIIAWASEKLGRGVTWEELFAADDVEAEATEQSA
jgi:transcriptional regulator with XRE-family HTH domain